MPSFPGNAPSKPTMDTGLKSGPKSIKNNDMPGAGGSMSGVFDASRTATPKSEMKTLSKPPKPRG